MSTLVIEVPDGLEVKPGSKILLEASGGTLRAARIEIPPPDDGRATVLHQLAEQFDSCSRPGWDGYGAEGVARASYDHARRFVESLPNGFPMPSVGAEPDGHLTLEWYQSPNRVLSLSISPAGDLHYAALLGTTGRRTGTEAFLDEVPGDLLQLIRRITSA